MINNSESREEVAHSKLQHAHIHTHYSIDEKLVKERPILRLMRPAAPIQLHTLTQVQKQ